MRKQRTNPDFLNGVPELLILQILSREPMYGYQLVQAISETSGEVLQFGEGCVYPLLHRLEQQKLLTGKRETANGRNRVVYRVTKRGHRRLGESSAKWQRVVEAINLVLQGGEDGRPEMA